MTGQEPRARRPRFALMLVLAGFAIALGILWIVRVSWFGVFYISIGLVFVASAFARPSVGRRPNPQDVVPPNPNAPKD
jgi:membrane protein implicated in regulation of membrane protease activity